MIAVWMGSSRSRPVPPTRGRSFPTLFGISRRRDRFRGAGLWQLIPYNSGGILANNAELAKGLSIPSLYRGYWSNTFFQDDVAIFRSLARHHDGKCLPGSLIKINTQN
jgi:hypothetical protein